MRFLPVNTDSFLVELPTLHDTLALHDALSAATLPGIEELVPAARTLLVRFTPWLTDAAALCRAIRQLPPGGEGRRQLPLITIPVCYDGEDLPALAGLLGLTVNQLVEHHQSVRWKVAFTGFAPGFAYLASPDWPKEIPRRTTPRTRIPAGALGLAGEFSGIYPQASPGGWQLIGHTAEKMWDIARQQPALLQPGAEVRFVPVSGQRVVSLPGAAEVVRPTGQAATGAMTIITPGLLTTWQDAGRPGRAAMGVGVSGARDNGAWRRANRLVGNPDVAALEITGGGLRARAGQDLVLAVTGAPCALTLVAEGQRFALNMEQAFAMQAGDELHIGPARRGVCSYLAIRGVCPPPEQLGSAARDTLAAVGPEPLTAGGQIFTGPQQACEAVGPAQTPADWLPAAAETVTLDIIAGPRTDWFSEEALSLLTSQPWAVSEQSNRIGLRLNGEQPLARSQHQELPSEGTCMGAIQVPASGQPVLFLRDHPLTGGYPVIAAVAPHHRDLAGQIPPGCLVRFHLISSFTPVPESKCHEE